MRDLVRGIALVGALLAVPMGAQPESGQEPGAEEAAETSRELRVDWGLEAKAHFRDSEHLRLPSPFPFPPDFQPPGGGAVFLETVDPGSAFEVSVVTLFADLAWGDGVAARAKIDAIDLYDRNPTSSDREIDVDELWIRFGLDPAALDGRSGLFARIGKFAHFERQDDRHLESYGLVSTAFNRFEDQGVELGAELGGHFYLRLSATQGNPLFFRDPNALAGDNGTPDLDPRTHPNPVRDLGSGFPILYDAEVEDLDTDGELELGWGVGLRFGEPGSGRGLDLLAWSYERELAETVELHGTFYGGDLDLLDGPFGTAGLPIRGDDKREVGGNLRIDFDGFSLFGQYVDQELAGMDRTGWEGELAWRFELPLVAAVGGRQLFPSLQPAVRYSVLEPEFAGGGPFPAPSVRWEWSKLDAGIRLGILAGIDLTVELQDNEMTLASGAKVSNDEWLATLRWRI
jgi:hypothetical protein